MGDKKFMRIMGLDVGLKTIGVAISDELGMTAQGLKTIPRKSMKEDFKELQSIISQFKIERIVIGLPKNMNGSVGKQAKIVLDWIENLRKEVSLPMETWDERLSTVEASKTLLKADLSRKKRKGVIDQLAAVLILQGYLQQFWSRKNVSSSST